jgi:hypothetical protein
MDALICNIADFERRFYLEWLCYLKSFSNSPTLLDKPGGTGFAL